MGYHARLGPSGAFRWSTCTASPGAEDGLPDNGNDSARAGTAEHEAAAECLEHGLDPWDYLGRVFVFLSEREEMWLEALPVERHADIQHRVTLDDEAIDRITAYVTFVRELVQTSGGMLLVENRVPIEHITGEFYWSLDGQEVPEGTPGAVRKPAGGTSDTIILAGDEFISVDYKSGQGRVDAYDVIKPEGIDIISGEPTPPVLAPNKQLAMYASGGLVSYGWMGEFKRIRLIIVQPRLGAISEYTCSREELDAFCETLRLAAIETRENPTFRPSEDACGFCKARLTCKARDEHMLHSVLDGFQSGDISTIEPARLKVVQGNYLGRIYELTDSIQKWCADIHRRVYAELTANRPVIRSDGVAYKLALGRAGNRKWTDPKKVEDFLVNVVGLPKELALDFNVIGPADAEKLAKAKRPRKGQKPVPPLIDADQWTALQALITQEDPKPVVTLATDPKPAVDPIVSGFTDSTPQSDLNLFD